MKDPGPISIPGMPKLTAWLEDLRRLAKSCRVQPGRGYRVNRSPDATTLDIDSGGGGGLKTKIPRKPFEIYASAALEVKAKGGCIIWQNQAFIVADSTAITIPANSTAFKIWLDIGDAFTPSAPTFEYGATGWPSYPAQSHPPARDFFLLAEVNSDAEAITAVNLKWHGGDIAWPGVFGFWA